MTSSLTSMTGESMNNRKKERGRVKDYIKKYFKGKAPKLKKIREHAKVMLGGTTSIYIVKVEVEGWGNLTYAFVTVAQSHPQGIIILNAPQIGLVMQQLTEGIHDPL
ncbi:MAG: hypothetical protein ACFFER_16230 [Candidatus Thorarchaeota archaeon]